MITKRGYTAGCIGQHGFIYAVGGLCHGEFAQSMECYDSTADRWTLLSLGPVSGVGSDDVPAESESSSGREDGSSGSERGGSLWWDRNDKFRAVSPSADTIHLGRASHQVLYII